MTSFHVDFWQATQLIIIFIKTSYPLDSLITPLLVTTHPFLSLRPHIIINFCFEFVRFLLFYCHLSCLRRRLMGFFLSRFVGKIQAVTFRE